MRTIGRMLRVGLTGGIGSGKSTVARRLSSLGAHVADADALAREVVEPGSQGLVGIVDRFGRGVLSRDGSLDRRALGAKVFSDVDARRDLEAITHPLIAARTAEIAALTPAEGIFVHDVPLLVEKAMGVAYHLVIVVHAAEQTRVDRLREHRGMTEEDARARIDAQATEAQRRAAADVWLENEGTAEELEAAVDTLWQGRLAPFAAHLAEGTPAPRGHDLHLVDADDAWAPAAERLLARMRAALGDRVVTADHIGSTAVPMTAKPVIDLQIGVDRPADFDDPEVMAALAEAGYPRVDSVMEDRSKEGDAPWPKRLHVGSDPGQPVHLHLREVGSPGWRWALLVRNWLRSEPQARRRYLDLKVDLAERGLTVAEYAAAKEPWFDSIHPEVQAWARDTGWSPITAS